MILLILIFIMFFNAYVILINEVPSLTDSFIKSINSENHSWTAARFFPANTSLDIITRLTGTVFSDQYYTVMPAENYTTMPNVPRTFDARKKWSKCPSINEIRNQGLCASCWAVATVSTISDRFCIYSNATHQYHFSSADLHTCCINLGGCIKGGYASLAWQYWDHFGIVSGGEYNSSEGCKPYLIPPCDQKMECFKKPPVHPACIHKCLPGFRRSYKKDKRFGKRVYTIKGGEAEIKAEIFMNGPVTAVFNVFSDFLVYKKGVYQHIRGSFIGGHAVKIIGWGVEFGHNYWLVANSWGKEWGDQGCFKILRGVDHCRIESVILAGEPSYDNHVNRAMLELDLFKNFKVKMQW